MTNDSAQPATTYQFGDSTLAAERLRRLAEVFNPSSRAFLSSLGLAPREIADLGCGPGNTSRMLAQTFPTAHVLGVDSSMAFIEIARETCGDRVSFVVADVTQALPGGPFDLIYCRYLLTHLSEPFAAIETWSHQLRSGGAICIEENDWIHTTQPVFTRYLEIATALLADAGQRLYVGRELDEHAGGGCLRKTFSQVVPVEVIERSAAMMFLPNLATWRDRPFVREHYLASELDELRDNLQRLIDADSAEKSISFGVRRIVLTRDV